MSLVQLKTRKSLHETVLETSTHQTGMCHLTRESLENNVSMIVLLVDDIL